MLCFSVVVLIVGIAKALVLSKSATPSSMLRRQALGFLTSPVSSTGVSLTRPSRAWRMAGMRMGSQSSSMMASRRHLTMRAGFLSALLLRSTGVTGFLRTTSTSGTSQQCVVPPSGNVGTCMAASTATDAVVTKEKKQLQPKYRASYRPPNYSINDVDLLISIGNADPKGVEESVTYVTSTLTIQRNDHSPEGANLELDGEALELMEVLVDGTPLPWDGEAFKLTENGDLIIPGKMLKGKSFKLQTKVSEDDGILVGIGMGEKEERGR